MTTPQFNTGISHMRDAITSAEKRAEAARSGGGSRLNYFNWKSGDTKVLRFLTDELITAQFAEFIMTSTGTTQNFMIPPNDPHILGRYQSPSPGIGWKQNFKTKALEEVKTREVGVGIAVLRDQKPDPETGKLVVEDYLYEQEIEGVNYLTRHFGIVQQSVSNFWHTLVVSCFNQFGSICDRDYLITRSGQNFDTKYSIIPLNPDPDLDTTEKVKQFYFYGAGFDKDDPQRFLKCPQTLNQWAEYYAGEDRFKYWLTPGEGADAPDKKKDKPAAQVPTYTAMPTQQAPAQPLPTAAPLVDPANPQTVPTTQISDLGANQQVSTPAPASTNFTSFKDDLIAQAQANQPK
jgi:hypothetical protein